ncbi:Ecp51 [Fulvia fulva]|uniref:Ecp51 n=1 Tax=Passalora fulva TaxID=5499 RepID=A0A1P8YXN7_PASFU|nr:Ecp51 [Fulvia fulva]AQA29273.1 extracellular protein 51 [Fulvia fulva]KAK4611811.1 Ecp51 [Fulvia fulva]KAK4613189.1 Ecp51 [Fulvia fulva]UJO23906.1 Ecp51 [Fulvia fulva]WPV21151.1 Ecp51 [Fulvia fulva]
MPSILLTLASLAATITAQALSSSETFVLYPYITSGELTGPYPNSAIDRDQPLTGSSGRAGGTFTTDCFNRFTFTAYVGTHCTGDQCGYNRWELNASYPSAGEDGYTLASYLGGGPLDSFLIAPKSEVDAEGRRDVGWTGHVDECGVGFPTSGLKLEEGSEGIVHLTYENQEDGTDVFGTFFTCWVEGNVYGPKLFYRNSEGTTPEGCAELLLVPRCTDDERLADANVVSQCYQGGLPA